MRFLLILGLVALTSIGSYFYGRRVLRLSNRELSAAWRTTLECVWFSLVFFALNLLVAFLGILALRVAVGRFISLYEVSDVTFLVLSFLQGIMFQLWRGETARLGR
jgi:hypothetical protein